MTLIIVGGGRAQVALVAQGFSDFADSARLSLLCRKRKDAMECSGINWQEKSERRKHGTRASASLTEEN